MAALRAVYKLTLKNCTWRSSSSSCSCSCSSSAPPSEWRKGWALPPRRNLLLTFLLPSLPVGALRQRSQVERGTVGPGRRRTCPECCFGPWVRRESERRGPKWGAFGGRKVSLRVETSAARQTDCCLQNKQRLPLLA